jgi:hypothetical protein
MPNIKWFDKLTTLSQVEGQITMTKFKIPNLFWQFENPSGMRWCRFAFWELNYLVV